MTSQSPPGSQPPVADPAGAVDAFLRSWHSFVATWAETEAVDRDALVRRVLVDGLPDEPPDSTRTGPTPEDAVVEACAIAVVRASGLLDRQLYLDRHPELRDSDPDLDPVEHYVRRGWRRLRNPSLDLDGWWYWAHHLDPADDRVDPLLHHLLVGRQAALPGQPVRQDRTPAVLPDGAVRRVCLFAGFDADGVVDATTVDHVRELSRFADVYYLAACLMEPGELDKLRPHARGAWAVPHDSHFVGSHGMLASELVGWQQLETYDEVLLVDDRCYLLRPLDELFASMDGRPGDWWGLQVTAPRYDGEGPGRTPLPGVTSRPELFPQSAADYDDALRVGPSFVGLRPPVVLDAGFRRRLERVSPQLSVADTALRYEAGTTQYLVRSGFSLALLVDDLLPGDPAHDAGAFELIGRGVPFLARRLLADNPHDTPDLVDWRARVLEAAPDVAPARLDAVEANLHRVSPHDRLHRSFAIRTSADGTVHVPTIVKGREARRIDRRAGQRDDWWAFPVCAFTDTFSGNERAVFDQVRDDPSLTKVVLTRSRKVEVSGENVRVVPLLSPEGQELTARCRTMFVKHSPGRNLHYPLSKDLHDFINVWHGIPLKRFGLASVDLGPAWERMYQDHARLRAVIASSKLDRLAMASAFKPVDPNRVWVTGLPRNDYILRAHEELPADLAAQEARLRADLGGRRLVLFLPTFKQGQQDSYYRFDDQQIAWLGSWAERHDVVLGIREHMADRAHVYSRSLAPLGPLDLSARRYPDLEILYRAADALITDYSSCVVDFMLTGKPVISFAYDLDRYTGEERGLFYRLDEVLPGPVCRDFDELSHGLDDLFRERTALERDDYDWKRSLFFDHLDDRNSARVVERVRALRLDA